jgi:branched-chain amino acid transport system ATP-binding protein
MLLEAQNLSAGYETPVVHDVSLQVEEGSIVALLGPNGAGKTTFVRALSGTVRQFGGRIIFDGRELDHVSGHARVDLGLVHVPQDRHIIRELTVLENLRLGALRREARRKFKTNLNDVLDLFPMLRPVLHQSSTKLSGGQQQMLAIGRGLMSDPRLLILDEPSLGLAPLVVENVYLLLRKIREQRQLAMLVIEQQVDNVLDMCSRAYVLEGGRVVLEGDQSQLRGNDELMRAYFSEDF